MKPAAKRPTCETCAFWKAGARQYGSRSVDRSMVGYCRRECAPTSNTGHCAGHCAGHQKLERVRVSTDGEAA